MYIRRRLGLFCLAFLGIAVHGTATTVTTTSYSNWLTTITTGSSVDVFGGLQNNQSYSTSSGISLSNSSHPSSVFVFTGPDNGGWSLSSNSYSYSGSRYNSLYGPGDGIGNITATMPTGGENAVMLGLGTSQGTTLTVKLSDGETFTPTSNVFGLSLSHDISWLTVSTTNGSMPVIFDFIYANSNLTQDQFTQDPTPSIEASSIILIGGGLLILAGGRRKLFG
jgi:hypothetical protein